MCVGSGRWRIPRCSWRRVASDASVIKRDFDGKQASNAAGAIRKAADNMGVEVEVVAMGGTVYIQKP